MQASCRTRNLNLLWVIDTTQHPYISGVCSDNSCQLLKPICRKKSSREGTKLPHYALQSVSASNSDSSSFSIHHLHNQPLFASQRLHIHNPKASKVSDMTVLTQINATHGAKPSKAGSVLISLPKKVLRRHVHEVSVEQN